MQTPSSPSAGSFEARVLLFARAAEIVGAREISITLTGGASAADAREAIASTAPELRAYLPHCRLAAGTEFAEDDRSIVPGETLALIPPVSGG